MKNKAGQLPALFFYFATTLILFGKLPFLRNNNLNTQLIFTFH